MDKPKILTFAVLGTEILYMVSQTFNIEDIPQSRLPHNMIYKNIISLDTSKITNILEHPVNNSTVVTFRYDDKFDCSVFKLINYYGNFKTQESNKIRPNIHTTYRVFEGKRSKIIYSQQDSIEHELTIIHEQIKNLFMIKANDSLWTLSSKNSLAFSYSGQKNNIIIDPGTPESYKVSFIKKSTDLYIQILIPINDYE